MMKFFVTICLLLSVGMVFFCQEVQALTVSPVKFEISGNPGETVKGELSFMNEQEGTKTFYSSFANFEAIGETGTPNFVEGKEGLATWITAPQQITLKKGEERKVPFTITIPDKADPGGHFAAIFWSTSMAKTGGVSIGAKIGTLVLLRVGGDIAEGGKILGLSTRDNQRFFSSLPIDFNWRFQNGGGDRVKPEGKITIRNIFGRTSAVLSANEVGGNILPQSVRKFDVLWNKQANKKGQEPLIEEKEAGTGFFAMAGRQWRDFHFGWYTAKLSLVWGATNQAATAKYGVFILPWQLLIIILLLLVILWFVGRIGLRKYNRWIVSKVMQKQKNG